LACAEALVKEVYPFLDKAHHENFLVETCSFIRGAVLEMYSDKLDIQLGRVKSFLVQREDIEIKETEQLGSELATAVKESFDSISILAHSEFKDLQSLSEKSYRSIMTLIVNEYEKASTGIRPKEMFSGMEDLKAFTKFECQRRLNHAIQLIQTQITQKNVLKMD